MAIKKGIKIIAENRKAYHDYYIDERYEAGVALSGTEVKSLRAFGRHDLAEEPRHGNVVFLQPTAVRTPPRVERLQLGILHQAVRNEVKPKHRSRLEAAMTRYGFRRNVENARL